MKKNASFPPPGDSILEHLPGMAYRCLAGPHWSMLYVSPGADSLTGYPPDDLLRNPLAAYGDLIHPADLERVRAEVMSAIDQGRHFELNYRIRTAGGAQKRVWERGGSVGEDELGRTVLQGFVAEVRAEGPPESAATNGHRRDQSVFTMVPVSILEEDWSTVYAMIDRLTGQGITDLAEWFGRHPEAVADALRAVRIIDVSDAAVKMFGATAKADLLGSLESIFPASDTLPGFKRQLQALCAGSRLFEDVMTVRTVAGDAIRVLVRVAFPPRLSGSTTVLVSTMDVTVRYRAQEIIERLAQSLSGAFGERFFEEITSQVVSALSATGGVVAMVRRDDPLQVYTQSFLVRNSALESVCYDVRGTPCEEIVQGHERVFAADLQTLFPDDPMLPELGLCAYAGVPLVSRDGRVLGVVATLYDQPISQPDMVRSALRIFAARVAAELEHRQANAVLAAEQQVLHLIAANAPLADVLACATARLEEILPGSLASVMLLAADGKSVQVGAAPSLPASYNSACAGEPIGPVAGSCGTAMYRREAVIVTDIATDPLWGAYRELALAHGLAACWSLPVQDCAGNVVASLAIYHRTRRAPLEEEQEIARRYVDLVGIAVEHQRKARALADSEERFRYVAQATVDTVWDWDLTTDTIWWNAGIGKQFGYQPKDLEAAPGSRCSRVHPEDRARVQAGLRAVIEGTGTEWEDGYRFRLPDGRHVHVEDRAFVVRDHDGRAVRMVGGMTDLTERMQLEEQVRQVQRLEAVGQLTGGVAHDFNNLLTVILGNAELLTEELAGNGELQPLAAVIQVAAQRGAALTGRLLAFARRQALEPRAVEVNRLVSGMDALLRRTLGEHIEIAFTRRGEVWQALVDPGQLEIAVLNLAINARDAMPGGGRLTIETANVHLDREYADRHVEVEPGRYVLVAVSDTGVGIAVEDQERVFEPFYTTKGVGQGSGLGLSMVYGFLKQSRGHVKLYSEPGQGTTVRMYLPRYQGEAPEAAEVEVVAPAVGGAETILLVEDDELVRRYARDQLVSLGYRVIEAGNGPQALAIMRRGEMVDLLFTDVVMPGGMSGRQLADAVRELRPQMKILYTSGYTENAIVHHGRLDPGVQLLSKPYRRTDLARRVREMLEGS